MEVQVTGPMWAFVTGAALTAFTLFTVHSYSDHTKHVYLPSAVDAVDRDEMMCVRECLLLELDTVIDETLPE